MPVTHYIPVALILFIAGFISIKVGKLTLAGGVTGIIIGAAVFAGAGYIGLLLLSTFFIAGTLATSWKKDEKLKIKSIEDTSVKRNAGQVLANGGVAATVGLLILFFPSQEELLRMMMAASLASATADTLSSELGMIYGSRFFNIISFKKEAKGLDGVISIEGLLIGILGSAIMAIIYCSAFGFNKAFPSIIIAGTIGNLADSVLGALFERKKYLNNDAVNFLNTLIAALAIGVMIIFL